MGTSTVPVSRLSANSKKIKNFQAKQKMRYFVIIIIIGLPLTLGLVAFSAYRQYTNSNNDLAGSFDQSTQGTTNGSIPLENFTQSPTDVSTSQNGISPSSLPQPATNQGGSPASPVSGEMPEGVAVALNSIEANGLKNNPYVAIDTSSLPDGVVVRTDRSTWTPINQDQGVVSGTITAFGQIRAGSLTFTNANGGWRVVSYSINP